MPAVPAPAKVLVTGASGFIATWVVKTLLEKGHTVVGTVRSKSKGEYLQNLFKEYGPDRFSYVIVEDIQKDGAFDQAVVGVDAVEHTASPFHLKADDPQELIGPALKGTLGILESIKKNGPGVKRVVITSSVASIIHDKDIPGPIYDESDWNNDSPNEIETKGKNASGVHKYRASKVLAERAAWDFVEKNKDAIAFDLVTVCPPMVWGPTIHEVPSVDKLNTSVADVQAISSKEGPPATEEKLKGAAGNWVDVRDVALVHTLALENPAAGGERFIVSGGPFAWQDVLDVLHATGDRLDVPQGIPGAAKDTVHIRYLSNKAEDLFGIKLRKMDETVPATLTSLREKGF